jgi:hypothetical protein
MTFSFLFLVVDRLTFLLRKHRAQSLAAAHNLTKAVLESRQVDFIKEGKGPADTIRSDSSKARLEKRFISVIPQDNEVFSSKWVARASYDNTIISIMRPKSK